MRGIGYPYLALPHTFAAIFPSSSCGGAHTHAPIGVRHQRHPPLCLAPALRRAVPSTFLAGLGTRRGAGGG